MTGVEVDAVLFAVFELGVVVVTLAVKLSAGTAAGKVVAMKVKVAVKPAGSVPMVVTMVLGLPPVPALITGARPSEGTAETIVTPRGSVSLSTTFAASFGPAFTTVTVQVSF